MKCKEKHEDLTCFTYFVRNAW